MGPIPFALSIHNFVHSVGADAGFASIIGLAVLVLLYFAQARETATLRERLDDSASRVGMLESRIAQLARAPVAVAPPVAPRPAAASALASRTPSVAARVPPDLAPLPGALAGLAAPALGSATKLIPSPSLVPARADAPAVVPAPVPVGAASAPDDTILVAPATAAAVGNGQAVATPPSPVAPVPQPSSSPAAPPLRSVIREDAGATIPPRRVIPPIGPPAGRQRPRRRLTPILLGLGAVAVVVIAAVVIIGSGSTKRAIVHSNGRIVSRSKRHRAVSTVVPADVTVAVLNGTAVNNVAHNIAVQLTTAGYKQGAVTNAASQTFTTSVVAYTSGHAAEAKAVARALKLPPSDVQPAGQAALAVACPPTTPATPCNADVIVTVGADLAGVSGTPAA